MVYLADIPAYDGRSVEGIYKSLGLDDYDEEDPDGSWADLISYLLMLWDIDVRLRTANPDKNVITVDYLGSEGDYDG